jgi:hypothetical protein
MQIRFCFFHLIEYNTIEKRNLKWISLNEMDHFNIFILCSGDVVTNVDHLHVKIIH